LLAFLQDFVNFKSFLRKKGRKNRLKEGSREVNEGKFVLNIDFIIALKPDGLCVYETTIKQDSIYNFSVSCMLNFSNKKESKVICKREFEIIFLHTQSLSIKPFN
jgi:hypothetical protein